MNLCRLYYFKNLFLHLLARFWEMIFSYMCWYEHRYPFFLNNKKKETGLVTNFCFQMNTVFIFDGYRSAGKMNSKLIYTHVFAPKKIKLLDCLHFCYLTHTNKSHKWTPNIIIIIIRTVLWSNFFETRQQ